MSKEETIIIDGETAIKPYYYVRNGLLHVRYTVDRCVELSRDENRAVKDKLTANPSFKQNILAEFWNLFTRCVGKAIIHDGIEAGNKRIEELSRLYGDNFNESTNIQNRVPRR